MTGRADPLLWGGALLVLGGTVWLAPLMLDQLVLFGGRQQVENASAARTLMPLPAMVLAAGAIAIALRGARLHAAVAALPLVAVGLALTLPDTALSIVAYGVAAPATLGALLAATLPARGRWAGPVILAAVAIVGAMALLAGSILAVLATLAGVAWWALSRRREAAKEATDASALD